MASLQIISSKGEIFKDRYEAGRLLAQHLKEYRDGNAVVLGVPRGGVIVGLEIARLLDAAFDIVLARKLGAPGNPELAIGAVAEDGSVVVDLPLLAEAGGGENYLEREKAHQTDELNRRAAVYRRHIKKISLVGRTVIITDDGLATGATMLAALRTVVQEKPAKTIVAVPVAPRETLERLLPYADTVFCIEAPPFFYAIGQFYEEFTQVDDGDMERLLTQAGRPEAARRK